MYENYGKTRRSYGRSNGGKFRKKVDVKKIVIAVAAILLMVALVAGMISLFSTKTKTIHPSFSVGALDSTDGKYVEVTSSIYTKNAFECAGLIVKVANDAHIKYQIFFYDDIDTFISASEIFEKSSAPNIPDEATQARVMITPDWEYMNKDVEDPEAETETENVIKWYEVGKYANAITITVNKNQDQTSRTVSLIPTAKWREDDSLYAIYYWNGSGSQFVILSDTDGDGIYTFDMPEGYHNYLFVDLQPGAMEATWDTVRDQTSNFYAE